MFFSFFLDRNLSSNERTWWRNFTRYYIPIVHYEGCLLSLNYRIRSYTLVLGTWTTTTSRDFLQLAGVVMAERTHNRAKGVPSESPLRVLSTCPFDITAYVLYVQVHLCLHHLSPSISCRRIYRSPSHICHHSIPASVSGWLDGDRNNAAQFTYLVFARIIKTPSNILLSNNQKLECLLYNRVTFVPILSSLGGQPDIHGITIISGTSTPPEFANLDVAKKQKPVYFYTTAKKVLISKDYKQFVTISAKTFTAFITLILRFRPRSTRARSSRELMVVF